MVRIEERAPTILDVNIPLIPDTYSAIKTNEKNDEEFRVYDSKESPGRVVEHSALEGDDGS